MPVPDVFEVPVVVVASVVPVALPDGPVLLPDDKSEPDPEPDPDSDPDPEAVLDDELCEELELEPCAVVALLALVPLELLLFPSEGAPKHPAMASAATSVIVSRRS